MSANLLELIRTLEAQKAQHDQVSAAITATLEQVSGMLGALVGGQRQPPSATVKSPATAKAAAPASSTAAKVQPKRKTFATTGAQSVLSFVRAKNSPTSTELRKHWEAEGRGGSVHDTISKLVAEKKIKRELLKGQPGSRYRIM